jgi:hypothetical protein
MTSRSLSPAATHLRLPCPPWTRASAAGLVGPFRGSRSGGTDAAGVTLVRRGSVAPAAT